MCLFYSIWGLPEGLMQGALLCLLFSELTQDRKTVGTTQKHLLRQMKNSQLPGAKDYGQEVK